MSRPAQIGHLVMEMTAPAKVLKEGMEYIRQQNVECEPIDKKIRYHEGSVHPLRSLLGSLFRRRADHGPSNGRAVVRC
ncbi:MAG: hypothetical protein MZV63_63780 [Marinilabiliales bacterium]|nr:hypothetical protein [Marinilabiliales bacterium]